jgi:hypothetical protein
MRDAVRRELAPDVGAADGVVLRAFERPEVVRLIRSLPAAPGYRRFGSRPAAGLGLAMHLPDWAPPEAAQAQPLSADEPAVRGVVVLPPEFDGLD